MATISLSPAGRAKREAAKRQAAPPPKKHDKQAKKEARKAANLQAQEQHQRKCERYRQDAAAWLAATFPKLFSFPPRPFEIGISKRILQERPPHIVPAGVKHCMNLWCTTDAYLAVRDSGARRITLEEAR